jgi:hypothetical protein
MVAYPQILTLISSGPRFVRLPLLYEIPNLPYTTPQSIQKPIPTLHLSTNSLSLHHLHTLLSLRHVSQSLRSPTPFPPSVVSLPKLLPPSSPPRLSSPSPSLTQPSESVQQLAATLIDKFLTPPRFSDTTNNNEQTVEEVLKYLSSEAFDRVPSLTIHLIRVGVYRLARNQTQTGAVKQSWMGEFSLSQVKGYTSLIPNPTVGRDPSTYQRRIREETPEGRVFSCAITDF